jgi:hypothetical protein
LEHTHTTVGCAQVNSNSWCFRHFQNCKHQILCKCSKKILKKNVAFKYPYPQQPFSKLR